MNNTEDCCLAFVEHFNFVFADDVTKKKGRKKRERGVRIDFDPNWFPMEWLAFIELGPLSATPHPQWALFKFYSQGPSIGNDVDLISQGQHESRREYNKKRREEKRQEEEMFSPTGSSVSGLSASPWVEDTSVANGSVTSQPVMKKALKPAAAGSDTNVLIRELVKELQTTNATSKENATIAREQLNADRDHVSILKTQAKISLLDKMNVSEEDKQKYFQQMFDSLS